MQDVGGHDAQAPALHQHHDHVPARPHVLDVMGEVLEFFELQAPDQRALKLREESMLGAGRIEPLEILVAVQHVDILAVEAGPEERVDGGARLAGVADGPDHAIRGIPYEIPSVSTHCFHRHHPVQPESPRHLHTLGDRRCQGRSHFRASPRAHDRRDALPA
jgi:hypothetical protein